MPAYLINEIPNIESLSYLELGIFDGHHFSTINTKNKISVDRDHPASYQMTTDAYFKQLSPTVKFDLVYIDADHDCRSIEKDFNNSLKHLTPNGSIFLHDLYPETEELTKPWYCGTGFIFLDALIRQQYPRIYTLDSDYGLTLVHQPKAPVTNLRYDLSYKNFLSENSSYPLLKQAELATIIRSLEWEKAF